MGEYFLDNIDFKSLELLSIKDYEDIQLRLKHKENFQTEEGLLKELEKATIIGKCFKASPSITRKILKDLRERGNTSTLEYFSLGRRISNALRLRR